MDYNKIGKFIANERKAKKLTQTKLAEKLFVSEKTVSKWENGNGIPDTKSISKLSEIFDVTINELLNGERINKDKYVSLAEDKLLELQKNKEDTDKRLLLAEIVLGCVALVMFFASFFASLYMIYELKNYVISTILIVISVIGFFVAMFFCLYIEQKAGYYVCKKCEHKHIPTYISVVCAMHIGRTRYLKCPHCNQRSWQKKVVK